MSSNNPGSNEYDVNYPPMGGTDDAIRSPPKPTRVIRKADKIERTPNRTNSSPDGKGTNGTTQDAAKAGNSRENKEPK